MIIFHHISASMYEHFQCCHGVTYHIHEVFHVKCFLRGLSAERSPCVTYNISTRIRAITVKSYDKKVRFRDTTQHEPKDGNIVDGLWRWKLVHSLECRVLQMCLDTDYNVCKTHSMLRIITECTVPFTVCILFVLHRTHKWNCNLGSLRVAILCFFSHFLCLWPSVIAI